MEDINLLLSYIETEIIDGKKPFVGGGVIINGETVLNLIKRIRIALPIATGDALVNDAREKANQMLEYAEKRRAQMLDDNIIMEEAKVIAEKTVTDALKRKELAEKQIDEKIIDMWLSLQNRLMEMNKEIAASIEKIKEKNK